MKTTLGTSNILHVCFGIVALSVIAFLTFIIVHWKAKPIVASQPFFLIMICISSLMICSAAIPLTIDSQHYSHEQCSKACLSAIWLHDTGLSIIVALLYSKSLWYIQASR